MSNNELALQLLESGLNPIPIHNDSKVPSIKRWRRRIIKEDIDNNTYHNIAVTTGIFSGGLEVIDIDLKYAGNEEEKREFFAKYRERIGNDLLRKLVIQETINGGYHFIYRTSISEGNRKLASNEDGEVLIETRGDGGYILIAPSEGYKIIYGDLNDITIISDIERNTLISAASSLNRKLKPRSKQHSVDDLRFPNFDGDHKYGVVILLKHGWTIAFENAEEVALTRPGKNQGVSAMYFKDKNFFYNYSSSVMEFETETPYNNHNIFVILNHGGDYKEGFKALYRLGIDEDQEGYESPVGDSIGSRKRGSNGSVNIPKSVKIPKSNVGVSTGLTFCDEDGGLSDDALSSEEDEMDYLEQALEDRIELGLKTGWDGLDENFRLKRNSVNIFLGFDGVGKSLLMSSIMTASNVMHDWKWIIAAPENQAHTNRRRIIEAFSGKSLKNLNKNRTFFNKLKDKAFDDFKIFKTNKHYTVDEVLEKCAKMYEENPVDAILLDPINYFRIEGSNKYEANNEMLSKLRVFASKYCAIFVCAHPISEATRTSLDEEGYLKACSPYLIQGGANWSYRVDNFVVFHRIKNHTDPEIRRTMQFIVTKVKEEETGGSVHSLGEYSKLIFQENNGFTGYFDEFGNSPLYDALKGRQSSIPTVNPTEAFE